MPPPDPAPACRDVAAALAAHGLSVRGGFAPLGEDVVPEAAPGVPARALVLVGNTGGAMWRNFAPHIDGAPHPLDRWTRAVVGPIAEALGARAVFPFEAPPLPFQRWAKRAEGLSSSPLGLLVHPVYGLWHAYRAALLFPVEIADLPTVPAEPSPCESCRERPCLSACPVGAFGEGGYDVPACASRLRAPGGHRCRSSGCLARDACPVGREHRYPPEQVAFHMSAFRRALGA
ncbi:ferredoxin [Lutibaculum baratangense]|uniref:Ferredoxin n=1 Tax=Lutibaculum baratangense AMV1 TaxID=631454 RepID=V4RUE6_9HYPH|nr:ferredoxin [Lutibaculum baratangense]ESR26700.1 Ferredoxin [Lutibaculum baratangense AMV1]